MMSLKRKLAVAALALALGFLIVRYYKLSQRLPESSVKIRIETQYSETGQPLLLTQAKGITSQSTMEELLRRLNRNQGSAEEKQQEILEIQKHVRVSQERNTEIFTITVSHSNPQWAKQTASQLALAFQSAEIAQARASAQAYEEAHERETAAAREKINTLEIAYRKIQMQNSPSNVDIALIARLRDRQAQLAELSLTYKDAHPDLIELNKEIESLKLQIMDGPPIDLNAVKQAEQDLRSADARYRQLRQNGEEIRLQKEQIVGHVKILEISSNTAREKNAIPPIYLAGIGLILLLSIVLRIVSR